MILKAVEVVEFSFFFSSYGNVLCMKLLKHMINVVLLTVTLTIYQQLCTRIQPNTDDGNDVSFRRFDGPPVIEMYVCIYVLCDFP